MKYNYTLKKNSISGIYDLVTMETVKYASQGVKS